MMLWIVTAVVVLGVAWFIRFDRKRVKREWELYEAEERTGTVLESSEEELRQTITQEERALLMRLDDLDSLIYRKICRYPDKAWYAELRGKTLALYQEVKMKEKEMGSRPGAIEEMLDDLLASELQKREGTYRTIGDYTVIFKVEHLEKPKTIAPRYMYPG